MTHPSFELTVYGLAAQAIADLILALLAWRFVRTQERSFLRLWAASWICLGAFHLCALGAITLGSLSTNPLLIAARTALSVGAQIANLWQVGLLLSGVAIVRGRPPIPRQTGFWLLGIGALIGIGVVAVTASLPFAPRVFCRVSTRSVLAGLAFGIAAVALFVSAKHRRAIGPKLVATTFAFYSASLLHTFAHGLLGQWGIRWFDSIELTVFPDLLIQMVAGFGLLLWVVEEESLAARRMAEELEARDRQLSESQKMEALGRLAGGVAHDFNNLLTTVLGNVDWLRTSSDLEPAHRAALEDVENAVRRGSAMTKQLQALSRGDSGDATIEDLNVKIEQLLTVLLPSMGPEVEVKVETSTRSCPIRVVRGQTEQVLLNLAINARDAMPDGGTIILRTRAIPGASGADSVVLEVEDTGVGMDAATVQRVFEPFFSTKPGGLGTGLGMTSVWNIVEKSGGTIQIESEPGAGTRIAVEWPRAPHDAPLRTTPKTPPQDAGPARILVVEDDDAVRASTIRTLREAGHTVTAAVDGVAALEALDDAEFDLVLSDVMMPRLDGTSLCARLAVERPDLRVTLMTGYLGGEQARPVDVPLLRKPFTGRQLVAFVAESLAVARGPVQRPEAVPH